MAIKRFTVVPVFAALLIFTGCKVKYSLNSTYISPEVQTVTIPFFENSAAMVAPILSPTFTNALQERFARQTKLTQVREGGDLTFEGEIVGYQTQAVAVTADEYASKQRLTITVRVTFTNKIQPEQNFTRTFSQFSDFDATQLLTDVEPVLIPEIVEVLIDDIFNASVSGW